MSPTATWQRRREVVRTLAEHEAAIASAVTDEFIERHPDWLERFGATQVRIHGERDARYHLQFLASAAESGDPDAFARYALWAAGMLAGRGIGPEFLAENLEQLRRRVGALDDAQLTELADACFDAAARALAQAPTEQLLEQPSDLAAVRDAYLQAIRAPSRSAARSIVVEALDAGANPPDVYVEVLEWSQRRIGELWAANEITVADEHTATAITQYVVNVLYEQLEPAPSSRGRALVTGVEGELHQLGAHIVADALEHDGWDVRFLGSNMPHRDIVAAVVEHRPQLLGISTTMPFNVPAVARLVEAVDAALDAAPRLLLGGRAFATGEVWRELGADAAAADVRGAIEAARTLADAGAAGSAARS